MNKPEGGRPFGGEAEKSKERLDYELACKYLEVARTAAQIAADCLLQSHEKKRLEPEDLDRIRRDVRAAVFYSCCEIASLDQNVQSQAFLGFTPTETVESGERHDKPFLTD